MRHNKLLLATHVALLFSAAASFAADPAPPPAAAQEMGRMHAMMADKDGAHHGHDHDSKGHRCTHRGMTGMGPMPAMLPLPSLPPGNEKLELQMRAEMMQKVGEILGRYASQVKDAAPAP